MIKLNLKHKIGLVLVAVIVVAIIVLRQGVDCVLYGGTYGYHYSTLIIYAISAFFVLNHALKNKMKPEVIICWVGGITIFSVGVYEYTWNVTAGMVFHLQSNLNPLTFLDVANYFISMVNLWLLFGVLVLIVKKDKHIAFNRNKVALILLVAFIVIRAFWIIAPFPHENTAYQDVTPYFPQTFLVDGKGGWIVFPNTTIRIINILDKSFLTSFIVYMLLGKREEIK